MHGSCQRARCASGWGGVGGGQCTQAVKSKGNQNSAWSVDQSVNEDLRDSTASCWAEIQAVRVKTRSIWGGQKSLQINAFHLQYRIMAGEEMEKDYAVFLCIIYHMMGSDVKPLCFHLIVLKHSVAIAVALKTMSEI